MINGEFARFGQAVGATRHGNAVVDVEYGETDSVGSDEKEVVYVMEVDRLGLGQGRVAGGMVVGI